MANESHPGQAVTWLHVQRGGCGFAMPVDAVIVSVGRLVAIEVVIRSGQKVIRNVKPENLRPRKG